ncbi:hypothetical protein [Castellaniella sp.]|uniref:hypothetical protein n=1 Tax=Castellaniella sp. TaxID=1955812 RepID=UPI002AFE52EB|nr:hypothetical protein [Castellaniella sp.]
MKKMILAAAVTLGLLTAWPAAQAGDIDLSIGIGIPGLMFGGPPVYYAPPPPPRVVVVPQPMEGLNKSPGPVRM